MRTIQYDPEDSDYVKKELEFARKCNDRANGIYYSGELAGPDGMSYIFFAPEGTTEEELKEAEKQLRGSQDVVAVAVMFVPPELVADDERDKVPLAEAEKIAKLRDVVANGYNKVEGVAVDGYSASAIVQVYDALSDENKRKFAALSIPKMATVAFKLCK